MVPNPSISFAPLSSFRGRYQQYIPVGILIVCLIACAGCSGEDEVLNEIRESYEEGNVEETIALCKRALRERADTGEIHLYYGLSLFHLGRDYQAFKAFESAVNIAPALAGKAATPLLEAGRRDYDEGRVERAAGRLKEAVILDPTITLGSLAYLVGDTYFNEKAYTNAVFFYKQALAAFPDTSAAGEAYLNMAEASLELGDDGTAEESLRAIMAADPWGAAGREAKWRLASLLSERAARLCRLGNYEETISIVNEMFQLTDNNTLILNSRFALGEAYEGLGNYKLALEQYRIIAKSADGVSASQIERAKEKIEDFRRAGLSK